MTIVEYRTIKKIVEKIVPGRTERKSCPNVERTCRNGQWHRAWQKLLIANNCTKAPDHAKADSRIKRYSRWIQNEHI